jgi:hypothetical protein
VNKLGRLAMVAGTLLLVGCSVPQASPPAAHDAAAAHDATGAREATAKIVPADGALSGRELCGEISTMTGGASVRVTSKWMAVPDRLRFSLPGRMGFRSAALTRELAAVACGLPRDTIANCAADFGVSYALTFTSGSRTLGTVTADPNGCLSVQFGGPRSPARLGTAQFWTALAEAVGLSTHLDNALGLFGPRRPF